MCYLILAALSIRTLIFESVWTHYHSDTHATYSLTNAHSRLQWNTLIHAEQKTPTFPLIGFVCCMPRDRWCNRSKFAVMTSLVYPEILMRFSQSWQVSNTWCSYFLFSRRYDSLRFFLWLTASGSSRSSRFAATSFLSLRSIRDALKLKQILVDHFLCLPLIFLLAFVEKYESEKGKF